MKNLEIKFAFISTIIIIIGLVLEQIYGSETISYIFYIGMLLGGFYKTTEGLQQTLKHKMLNVEILMILAAIGAILLGKVSEAASLIVIFSISGALENYTKEKSKKELSKLINLTPTTTTKIVNEKRIEVCIDDLQVGDIIEIKPGGRIPIDCTVVSGTSQIDNSALTGEAFSIDINIDDSLYSGAINLNSIITCHVDKLGVDSMLQKIVQVVKDSENKKPSAQVLIEKYENLYVIIIILLALFISIFASLLFGIDQSLATYKALVLLVVASPCAIMASVSSAVLATISHGAKNGVLIKGGLELEELSRIKAICFDKTGTLTNGTPLVTDIVLTSDIDISDFYSIVNNFEKKSTHPLANAVVNYTNNFDVKELLITDFLEIGGFGLQGLINKKLYKIGNHKHVEGLDYLINESKVKTIIDKGETLIYVADDKNIIGVICLSDALRDDAIDVVAFLKDNNIKPIMITGDNENNARIISKQVAIERYYANTIPGEKQKIVEKLVKEVDTVCMIGDGINDAPALAMASVSMAMGHGSEIAVDTADIVLMKNDLSKVKDIIKMAKRLSRTIKVNFIFSAVVIATMIILNLFFTIDLPTAVVIHEGSTILVILYGIRLLK